MTKCRRCCRLSMSFHRLSSLTPEIPRLGLSSSHFRSVATSVHATLYTFAFIVLAAIERSAHIKSDVVLIQTKLVSGKGLRKISSDDVAGRVKANQISPAIYATS